MKMLKKAAAVLLAAAMSIVMLTACGGGSSSVAKTDEQKVEDAYMAVFEEVLGKECTNDVALKAQLKDIFAKNVADDNKANPTMGDFNIDEAKQTGSMYSIVVDDKGYAVGLTSDEVNQLNNPQFVKDVAGQYSALLKSDAVSIDMSKITKVAVAGIKKGDKTYTILGFTIEG